MKFTPFLLTFLLIPSISLADISLSFGLYATDRPSELIRKFKPLMSAIENQMTSRLSQNVSIKIVIAKSYQQGLDNVATGKVDFSRLGPASYINVSGKNPDVSLLAMEGKKGRKIFHGVICAKEDSPLQNLPDLKGKKFAFGNKLSTIGRYLSQSALMNAGIHADDLDSFDYLGRHDKVGSAVAAGKYDAGALKESTYKKLIKKGKKLKAIARFENVTKPWVASASLKKEYTVALKESLLAITDEKALKTLKASGFLVATDSDYAPVRQSMDENYKFTK